MDWLSWLSKFWSTISGIAGKEIGAIIATAVVALLWIAVKAVATVTRRLIEYHLILRRVRQDVGRDTSSTWPREGKGLWRAKPVNPPAIQHATGRVPKVLVVANAKGGVGKTTVSANVAARLSELASAAGEKPILLIDLDFQGTLSAMSVVGETDWLPQEGKDSDASYLISRDWKENDVAAIEKSASSIGHNQNPGNAAVRMHRSLRLITSFYDLAQAENRIMIEWLIGARKEDARFRLRQLLWSDMVIGSYSAIVIDCPPRFTTAAIQAFAAATHFLMPTKLDLASREAVLTFIDQIEILRGDDICWSEAQHIGAVATMVDPRANVENLRKELNDKLARVHLCKGHTECLPSEVDIHENVVFRNAGGKGIAYFGMGNSDGISNVKLAINRLAFRVAREMMLPQSLQKDPDHEVRDAENVA